MVDSRTEALIGTVVVFMMRNDITRATLAEQLGITVETLRMKLCGASDWRWQEILKLSEITGKSPDEMCGIANQS
jgi:plasmid maintenance system antidote protein VapI